MCVAENISKTVANIKSMYCRVTRGKGGTKKCVYIYVYICMVLLRIYACATYVLRFLLLSIII